MIAYNHNILLKSSTATHCEFENELDTVTIEEKPFPEISNHFNLSVPFFNNQGREVCLYSNQIEDDAKSRRLWAFDIKGVALFYWYKEKKEINYIAYEDFSEELLQYWVLHTVLPVFFTTGEYYDFLHAGAVEVDEKPILFIASSYGGKSTMTDFFMKQGHTMISDDKVGVYEKDGAYYALPSHPHHRPYRQMEDIGLAVKNFAQKPKPIHAIYLLTKAPPEASVEIAPIVGAEKLIALRKHSEVNFSVYKPKRLKYLGLLSKKVHLFSVKVPWDTERLQEVYEKICVHCSYK
ncbi:MAG: hypothetical protein L3J47_12290 [Sulfurovum sp.]|nr:hypothetical protein [Sulfurovum sp.]